MSGLHATKPVLFFAWIPMVAIIALAMRFSDRDDAELTSRYEAGDERRYTLRTRATWKGDPEDSRARWRRDLQADVVVRVIRSDASGAILDLSYQSLRGLSTRSGRDVMYDSDDAPAVSAGPEGSDDAGENEPSVPVSDLEAALSRLVSQAYRVRLDPDSNVISVSAAPPHDSLEGSTLAIQGWDPANHARWLLESRAPDDGVARDGQGWRNEDRNPDYVLGRLERTTTHQVKSIRTGIATLGVSSRAEVPAPSESGITLSRWSLSGKARWDVESGAIDSLRLEGVIHLRIRGAAGSHKASVKQIVEIERHLPAA